jgi:ankyrin repeat protein
MDRSESFSRLCALAVEAKDGKLLEPLFPSVRDINDVDGHGHTPLWHAAASNEHLSVIESLLEAGSLVDLEVLVQAVMHNPNPGIARRLYAHVAPVGKEELDHLFLLAAASNTCDELVRFFVNEGADPHATMPMDLYPTTGSEEPGLVDSDDVWWDEEQEVRQNALVVAMYENPDPVTMVRTLLELGVDPNAFDTEGYPVLVHALDNVDVVRTLLEGGADCDLADNNGMTPLMHACAADNNEVALLLLRMHADVHAKSSEHENALHFALGCHLQENSEVIRALIAAGCDVNEPDGAGLLPLDIARFNYCAQEVIDLLERSGAENSLT